MFLRLTEYIRGMILFPPLIRGDHLYVDFIIGVFELISKYPSNVVCLVAAFLMAGPS